MSPDSPTIYKEGRQNIFSSSIYIKAEYFYSPFISFATGLGITGNQGGRLVYENSVDVWADSDLTPPSLHNLPEDTKYITRLQYLEIPFALKIRTDELGRYRVFFEVPRFTLGITSKARGDIRNNGIEEDDQNIYQSVSRFNLSYGVMGGIEYSLTENISGIIGLNWKQGFVDVTDDSGIDSKITTGTFGLHLGVLF